MRIRILDEAQSDLREGAQFYEQHSNGLGLYFLIKIDGYFRLLSKSFPFAVYYCLDGDTVNVYAVLDCRKNPNRTIEQLKQRRA